jgi:hypothetical protein
MLNVGPVANDDSFTIVKDTVPAPANVISGTQITPFRWLDNGHYYAFIPRPPVE